MTPTSSTQSSTTPVAGLRIGLALPQSAEGRPDPGRLPRFAQAAERLGFDGLWVLDTTQGPPAELEPLTALTHVASHTTSIRLGVAVLVLPLRAPVELARTAATLDWLSGGRLDLGVGLGTDAGRARSLGLDPSARVARFVEGIEAMRRLWAGGPASLDGATLRLDDWVLGPRPIQVGGPPVWIGGRHPNALRRAVRIGDGWIGGGTSSVEDFVRQLDIVRGARADAPPDARAFGVGKRLYLGLDDGRGMRESVRHWFADHYRDAALADRVAVVGPPQLVIDAVLRIARLGADLVILNPVVDEDRQARRLAEEVVPVVRAALSIGDS